MTSARKPRWHRGKLWVAALLAIGVSQSARALPDKQLAPVSAVLEVLSEDDRARVVEPAEVLCSGERFRLEIEVQRRSFVYVAQGRDGKTTVLYPLPGMDPLRLDPGRIHQVPDDANFELDGRPGVEQIFVVASPQKLTRESVERLVSGELRGAVATLTPNKDRICGVAKPERTRQPAPDGALERYRDIVLRQGLKRHKVMGANLVRIPILHR